MALFFSWFSFKTIFSSEENGDCNNSNYVKTFWCFCSNFALIVFLVLFKYKNVWTDILNLVHHSEVVCIREQFGSHGADQMRYI